MLRISTTSASVKTSTPTLSFYNKLNHLSSLNSFPQITGYYQQSGSVCVVTAKENLSVIRTRNSCFRGKSLDNKSVTKTVKMFPKY